MRRQWQIDTVEGIFALNSPLDRDEALHLPILMEVILISSSPEALAYSYCQTNFRTWCQRYNHAWGVFPTLAHPGLATAGVTDGDKSSDT